MPNKQLWKYIGTPKLGLKNPKLFLSRLCILETIYGIIFEQQQMCYITVSATITLLDKTKTDIYFTLDVVET